MNKKNQKKYPCLFLIINMLKNMDQVYMIMSCTAFANIVYINLSKPYSHKHIYIIVYPVLIKH